MNNKSTGLFEIILAAVIGIALSVLSFGFVLSILWQWFIVPISHLPSLTTLQAAGIVLIVKMLSPHHPSDPQKSKEDAAIEFVTYTFMVPLLILLTGFILSLFM